MISRSEKHFCKCRLYFFIRQIFFTSISTFTPKNNLIDFITYTSTYFFIITADSIWKILNNFALVILATFQCCYKPTIIPYIDMEKSIHLKRGLDLNLQGGVDPSVTPMRSAPNSVAIVPDDFPGLTPKLEVKEGDRVKRGQPLLHDKTDERLKLTSPVTGTVEKIVRGDRRKIERVVITVNPADDPLTIEVSPSSPASVKEALLQSGLWAMMRQRPYDIIPSTNSQPRDIFITAFDSAPLAPSLEASVADKQKEIIAGIKALKLLTTGDVYVGVRPGSALTLPEEAVKVIVEGPHPAGNAGVQAANIAPINKGETIWTLDIVTVSKIGALILTGRVDGHTIVAVTGSETINPEIIISLIGADIESLVKGNVKEDGKNHRIISGNVLTGVKVDMEGYLRYPYRQITVIPEGDDVDEFMGWASIAPSKMSVNRSFPSRFLPSKKFSPDARLNGGRRAMIMSGAYDKVLPMDILPEYLFKAIISRDIDRMESLGIYEIAPEDVALCEYVDPSKIELQKLVREGLDYLRKELS